MKKPGRCLLKVKTAAERFDTGRLKTIADLFILLPLLFCAEQKEVIDRSSVPPPVAKAAEQAPAAPTWYVPVQDWAGKRFVVLDMPPMFRKFGYELYPTPALASEASAADPKKQLSNRRFRYEVLMGKTLVVTEVARVDSEYSVHFFEETAGTKICARTHKGAVKGLAPAEDRDSALQRWKGKQVFARKRQINTCDTASGKMGSVKLTMDQPLEVTDVRWGMPPLPPQALWVYVRTGDGQQGFVPAQISWTNVLNNMRRDYEPWLDFLLTENPRKRYGWDDEMWGYISKHKLVKGMDFDQARLAWEEPVERDSVDRNGAPHQRWTYPGQYLYFRDGKLSEIVQR